MKIFKLKYFFLIFFIIFSGIALNKFRNSLSFSRKTIFEGRSVPVNLSPNSPIIQRIVPKENNLSQIATSIHDFSPRIGDKIILQVADEDCGKIYAESEINIYSWETASYDKFSFPPIADSGGKIYCLRISYMKISTQSLKKLPYIKTYSVPGSSFINSGESIEEQKDQSLSLRLGYGGESVWQNFSHLTDRISQYKPGYLKDGTLKIIFLTSIVLVLAVGILVAII